MNYRFAAVLLVLACSKRAPEPSAVSPASGGSAAVGGGSGGQAMSGGAGGAAGTGGATDGPRYPDAPSAPERKALEAPVLEPVIAAGPADDWHARDNAALAAMEKM